jgi:hypothetical protein
VSEPGQSGIAQANRIALALSGCSNYLLRDDLINSLSRITDLLAGSVESFAHGPRQVWIERSVIRLDEGEDRCHGTIPGYLRIA